MMGILEDILARLERIESAVSADRKTNSVEPPQTFPDQPAVEPPGYGPAPATGQPAYGPPSVQPAPQPAYGPPPTTATPVAGPVAVPTFQELYERLMDLNQAKGEMVCLDLLRAHGGQDAQGSVNLKQVPQGEYVALYAAIGNQLQAGAH